MTKSEFPRMSPMKRAALVTAAGYLMSWGVPYADFVALPKLFVATDAAQTAQYVLANRGLLVFVIYAFLINFVGDVLAAWGLYVFLRPVDEAFSKLVAWFRIAFATLGIAALLNLVTAYRLVTRPATLVAIGQRQIDALVYAAISSFNVQFAFLLIFFGVYLVLLGWLAFRASYFPRWLAVLLVLAGVAWILRDSGPYLMAGANLEFLLIPTFAEVFLLVWMIGWGTRVKLPDTGEAM